MLGHQVRAGSRRFKPTLSAQLKNASAKKAMRSIRRKQTQKIVVKARKSAQQKLEIWNEHLIAARRLKMLCTV